MANSELEYYRQKYKEDLLSQSDENKNWAVYCEDKYNEHNIASKEEKCPLEKQEHERLAREFHLLANQYRAEAEELQKKANE